MESSRIFVRGLPPKFSEDDVRKHFARFPVTDVKFFPHRRIGYVGYKTPEDAAKAVKYFNKTFINLSKIYAEIARPVRRIPIFLLVASLICDMQISDKDLPKSRRLQRIEKATPRNDEYKPNSPQENVLKRKRDEIEQDPKLKEFLQVYQAPSKTNIWTNGDTQVGVAVTPATDDVPSVVAPEDESDDEYQVITKKPKPMVTDVMETSIARQESTPLSAQLNVAEVAGGDSTAEVETTSTSDPGPVTDADWLRSRTNRILDLVEDDEPVEGDLTSAAQLGHSGVAPLANNAAAVASSVSQPVDEEKKEEEIEEAVVEQLSTESDKIRTTGRLYLRNLHFDVTEDDLREHFAKYGVLEEVSC